MAVDGEQRRVQRHEVAKVRAANLVAVGGRERELPVGEGERRRVGAVALVVRESAQVRGVPRAVDLDGQDGAAVPGG